MTLAFPIFAVKLSSAPGNGYYVFIADDLYEKMNK